MAWLAGHIQLQWSSQLIVVMQSLRVLLASLVACSHPHHPQAARLRKALEDSEKERDKFEGRVMAADVVLSDPELVADVLSFYK